MNANSGWYVPWGQNLHEPNGRLASAVSVVFSKTNVIFLKTNVEFSKNNVELTSPDAARETSPNCWK